MLRCWEMEPSLHDRSQITSIETLAEWADISAEPLGSQASAQKSFFSLLGCSGTEHYRLIALIPDDEFSDHLGTWQVDGQKASATHRSSARLFHTVAQSLCGLRATGKEQQNQIAHFEPPSSHAPIASAEVQSPQSSVASGEGL